MKLMDAEAILTQRELGTTLVYALEGLGGELRVPLDVAGRRANTQVKVWASVDQARGEIVFTLEHGNAGVKP